MAKDNKFVIGRFRLEVSLHIQDEVIRDKKDPTKFTRGGEITYMAGDVFDSTSDLETMNGPGMAPKFVKVNLTTQLKGGTRKGNQLPEFKKAVDESRREAPGEDTFQSMTEAELRAVAADDEIDLKGAKTKEDIIKVLVSAAQAM